MPQPELTVRLNESYTIAMEVHLKHEHELFIASSVSSGHFPTTDDVMGAAIELLRRQTELQGMRAFVQDGLNDLESGEFDDFTEDTLHELFQGVRERGNAKLARERLT